ncbi:hypothetical protein PUNSTDRAFT_142192 [Punctularia strigosozonata HHB-11173 SS5]|uniref:uncharacterized protein n=1 Tax=Punctularia strigosozonata (strain HHB-11173) TaxID=741275 RepID=UPI0004417654|nr:uncharacterized protein PUNSTDRAFT_142192 [Punctularia strigosozonata HHB-11173 SS5]EIN12029.1 hypothetical protein PUNSTDRAFT_142192 [Punctularia strigosozonata HHB-11173 SS5]
MPDVAQALHALRPSVVALANNHMRTEGDVNAVWNALINVCYSFPEFTIAPEGTPVDGASVKGTVDLLVRQAVAPRTAIVFFEGKAITGDSFKSIRTQLLGYLRQLPNTRTTAIWAIAARGHSVGISAGLRHNSLGNPEFYPLSYSTNTHLVTYGRAGAPDVTYDMVTHYDSVVEILNFIRNNSPNTNL